MDQRRIIFGSGRSGTTIISEIIFSSSFVILSYFFMDRYGVIGATYAFCLNYALYWVLMVVLMRKYIF